MRIISVITGIFIMIFSISASAQEVKIGGELHANLNSDLSDNGNSGVETAFETTRLYLTTKAKLNKVFSFRSTLDFGHFTGDATSLPNPLLGYIKYAYFQIKPMKGLKIRFGQQSTPWIGTMDKIMGYRYVYKTGLDYYKLGHSADTGLSILGSALSKMLRYHVGIYNGNGYKSEATPEEIQNLQFAARFSIFPMIKFEDSPLKKLGLHFYFKTDATEGDPETVRGTLFGGAISFNQKYVDFNLEIMTGSTDVKDDKGFLMLAPYLKLKYQQYSLFATYGLFKDNNKEDNWTRLIAGATWDYSKKFGISLSYQMVSSKGNTKGADSSEIFLNTVFKF